MHVVILAAARHPLRQPFAGGLESLTWALVRGLRHRGVDVTVFAGPGSDPVLDARELTVAPLRLSDAARKNHTGAAYDKALYQAEQQLLYDKGLPARSWYKHTLYAPGFYTGYGVKTIPGVREAIEQRRWTEAQEQIAVVAAAINRFTAHLNEL